MRRIFNQILIVGLVVTISSCGKNWLSELGSNPNQPSSAPGTLILPPILTGYAANTVDGYQEVGAWMGYYSYSGSYSITTRTATYWVDQSTPVVRWPSSTNYRTTWDALFSILTNVAYLETSNEEEEGMENFVAAAKILKAYGYQFLVDAYEMTPYSDAFKAGEENLFPAYDEGQDIYNASVADLNLAIEMIEGADVDAATLGSDDIMFGGDMEAWAQFANTLKLKFLIRQSNVISDADAKAEIDKTKDIGYLDEDALVNPGYSNTNGKQSPLWADLGTTAGGDLQSDGSKYRRAGKAMVDFLSTNGDKRLFYLFAPAGIFPDDRDFTEFNDDIGDYIGVFYGDRDDAADKKDEVSGVGNGVLSGYDASVALISAAESFLLQAEAAQRGWLSEDAKELYEAGITASFETLYDNAGATADAEADAEAYYSQNRDLVGWDASSNKIKAIIMQKWVASTFTNNAEAWNEYRRTGYPNATDLPLSKYPQETGRSIPTKFQYPKSEADRNSANYNAAVAKGNDPQGTKVFWAR